MWHGFGLLFHCMGWSPMVKADRLLWWYCPTSTGLWRQKWLLCLGEYGIVLTNKKKELFSWNCLKDFKYSFFLVLVQGFESLEAWSLRRSVKALLVFMVLLGDSTVNCSNWSVFLTVFLTVLIDIDSPFCYSSKWTFCQSACGLKCAEDA